MSRGIDNTVPDERLGTREERRLRAVLDALPAHVAVLDGTGRIVAVNEAWRRFGRDNGASPELIAGVGVDYLAACRQAGASVAAEGIRAVMVGSEAQFTLEYPCHAPDRQRWFLVSARPLCEDAGGVVLAHIDVTERVVAEHERQYRREQLHRAARLSSLAALSASVIHEIAQPLAAAKLYGEAVHALWHREPFDGPRLLGVVENLNEQVERAIAIADGLRKFMRGGDTETEPVVLQACIREAVSLLGVLARHRDVALDVALGEAAVWVRANPLQIQQVLVNLLCNAVEAIARANSPMRRLRIELDVVGDLAQVSVIDSGPGFGSGEPSFAFFDCGPDIAGEHAGMGMGIGLAISRAIIEAHGGALWAEPQAAGATLRFTLPALNTPFQSDSHVSAA